MKVRGFWLGILMMGVIFSSYSSQTLSEAVKNTRLSEIDKRYTTKDPNEVVVTDIESWHHPVKKVFRDHNLKLTKVELMWNKEFPVFHVATLEGDPVEGASDAYFHPILEDILEANGRWSYKIVSDDYRDGFLVLYDAKTHTMLRQPVEDEDR